MSINMLKCVSVWLGLGSASGTTAPPPNKPFRSPASTAEFDAVWHGDHWQNLLASPLDARRYVIEDWSPNTTPSCANIDDPPAKGRRRRLAHGY